MAKGKAVPMLGNDYYHPESDVRTLMEAHHIRSDKKRHAAAMAHAKTRLAAMQKVAHPDDETVEKMPDNEKGEK